MREHPKSRRQWAKHRRRTLCVHVIGGCAHSGEKDGDILPGSVSSGQQPGRRQTSRVQPSTGLLSHRWHPGGWLDQTNKSPPRAASIAESLSECHGKFPERLHSLAQIPHPLWASSKAQRRGMCFVYCMFLLTQVLTAVWCKRRGRFPRDHCPGFCCLLDKLEQGVWCLEGTYH